MISELACIDLPANAWGNKANRLNKASVLGMTIPPGLCIQYAAAFQSPTAAEEALSAWLKLYQPPRVIVRMSSTFEDGLKASNAGKTVSIADCTPSVVVLMEILNERLLPFAASWADNGGGLSLIFQYQLQAQFGGVAFLIDNKLTIEAESQSTSAITAGSEPTVRIEMTGAQIQARGRIIDWPVITIASSLFTACSRMKNHFGFDVDVEWAWLKGVLYILQVRPVTVSI